MENSEYNVKQIWPNHADHVSYYKESYLNEMFEHEHVIAQRKYDGERMLVHFNGDEIYCTSRRHSKKTNRFMENQDKIMNMPKLDLNYTVVDCEFYSNDWASAVGILHSLPERAYELQKSGVPVKFALFDCIWFDGTYIGDEPYLIRLSKLAIVYDKIKQQRDFRFHIAEGKDITNVKEMYEYRDKMINAGYEGIVVKSLDRKYYDKGASLKCKRFETVDVVVYDYQQGTGKYSNTIGALLVGYYDDVNDKIVHVSKVNCGTDSDRDYWRDNWSVLKNSVLEVKCQEITNKSLRHPVYVRIRKDKDYRTCTKDTIFTDKE